LFPLPKVKIISVRCLERQTIRMSFLPSISLFLELLQEIIAGNKKKNGIIFFIKNFLLKFRGSLKINYRFKRILEIVF